MNIHEYQACELFRSYGIPVPRGGLALDGKTAYSITEGFGGRSVVKAQIHSGGRGKAGGVKLAASPEEAAEITDRLIGSTLVTKQTGEKGKLVRKVYVTETADIAGEFYFSITMDNGAARPVLIFSIEGGTEIEELARTAPDRIGRILIDPVMGLRDFEVYYMLDRLAFPEEAKKQFISIALSAFRLFMEKDCSLVEINPLVISHDGKLLAIDAKIGFDDNAVFRHPDIAALRDTTEEEERETRAKEFDLNYIQLDGNIACMVNGAGLAMATMDIIKAFGGSPANFLDVGGGATEEKIAGAFEILLSDSNVRGIFINIFGGIMKCDIIASGVVSAARKLEIKVPLVVRLTGTREAEGKAILAESGLKIIPADDLRDGARKICEIVKEASL
jgi:succinyl-CoA synthetase beta subunit